VRKSRKAAAFAAAGLGSMVVAVSALGSSSKTAVAVTAGKPAELKFTLSKTSAAKGVVSFKVTNKGTLDHNFKIAGKKTALLKPGKSTTLTVTINKAGKYPFLCTVKGHALAGMKGTFTVRAK
jgi:plastocyanin